MISKSRRGAWAVGACGVAAIAGLAAGQTTPHPGMLRQPAVSDSRIAFIYANQIWTAPRSGGTATLVAAPPVRPSLPRFSPDGKTIAFMANFDGNPDLYTVPTGGGELTRVTYHPTQEILCGWRDDARLLFFAPTLTDSGPGRIVRLYSVSKTGGLPERLPMPYAAFGAVSGDGKTAAFAPLSTDNATWRRYRGGMAQDLWTMDLSTLESKRITEWEGTDTMPMWGYNRASGTVYYLSDNGPEHRLNIWAYDTASGQREQVTKYADRDVRFPSIGPGPVETRGKGEIVFQLGSQLMLLDLDSKEARAVSVTIPGARPRVRERTVDASQLVTGADLSPSGKRVLLIGRGDVWSVPAKEGATRNLTRTAGEFERDAAWSPDGRWIAYLSDAGGEYDLYLRASDARAEEEKKEKAAEEEADAGNLDATSEPPAGPVKLTDLGPGFRFNPRWSPDSKHVVLTDNAGRVILVSLEFEESAGGKIRKFASASHKVVATDPWADDRPGTSWSHDSAWLAYSLADEANGNTCIHLYNVASGESTRVTAPYFAAGDPAFDRKGEFLYYTAASEFSSPDYADGDTTFVYSGTQRLMMVPLRRDVKSPMAPKSDEEQIRSGSSKREEKGKDDKPKPGDEGKDGDRKPEEPESRRRPRTEMTGASPEPGAAGAIGAAVLGQAGRGGGAGDASKKDEPLKIDLDGFESRAVRLPVSAGNFGGLSVNGDGELIYVRRRARGEEGAPSIKIIDMSAEKKEEKTVVDDVGGYTLSANGKKLLAGRRGKWMIYSAEEGGGKAQEVPTGAMKARIDPRAEWKQIVADAWRLERDFFYVSNLHGVDWEKIRADSLAMLGDAASREDVQFIIGEMISQLNIGHAYLGGAGDLDQAAPESAGGGVLGCDFELARDSTTGATAYRFKTIYSGAPWDAEARGPLAESEPEKDRIVAGEYLLAVNGVPVDISKDPWASLVGLADTVVTLTVNVSPVMDGHERDVLVTAVGSDQAVRFRSWIEANRKHVERATEGKVGYIYVPNTGVEGQNELFRQFFAQRGCEALIIDDRWNGGGQIPTRFIELLNRPVTNYWARRHGRDWTWPPDGHQGPKCMLINGQAGSGGDMFPWLFKQEKLGKLIGMRTWGGLVGIQGSPPLIDGGGVTVPSFGFYEKDGTWGVEGHGVDPDIEVIDDPGLMAKAGGGGGPEGDVQLKAAIDHMLAEIAANPYKAPKRPADPDRSGMGLPEADR